MGPVALITDPYLSILVVWANRLEKKKNNMIRPNAKFLNPIIKLISPLEKHGGQCYPSRQYIPWFLSPCFHYAAMHMHNNCTHLPSLLRVQCAKLCITGESKVEETTVCTVTEDDVIICVFSNNDVSFNIVRIKLDVWTDLYKFWMCKSD